MASLSDLSRSAGFPSSQSTAGAVIRETGLQRSATYFCLDSLIRKGIVGYAIRNDRKHFEANRPESLFELLAKKKKEIEEQEKELKKVVPALFERKPQSKVQVAKIYDGWKGVLNSFFDALTAMKPGDESFAFTPSKGYGGADSERVRWLIKKVRLERARRRIRSRVIVGDDLKRTLGNDLESTPYTEVKYLSTGRMAPAVVNVFGEVTLIIVGTKIPLTFMINSREVADSFKTYFELIWKMAK